MPKNCNMEDDRSYVTYLVMLPYEVQFWTHREQMNGF
jgi:hypothetical protein